MSARNTCAVLELSPITGITHQVRVHLGLGLSCPILGDHKYTYKDKMVPQVRNLLAYMKFCSINDLGLLLGFKYLR